MGADASLPSPHPPLERPFRVLGHIDHVSHRVVRGWAWSPDMPTRRLQLDVFCRDIFLGRVSTGHFRADLLYHGLGDGHAGFTFRVPPDVPDGIHKADYYIASAGPGFRMMPAPTDAAAADRQSAALPVSHRQMLGPFLASLRNARVEPVGGTPGRRPRIDVLCGPAASIGASAFVEHIARKFERPELATGDEAGLWRWYLGTYEIESGPRRVPLSRDDIRRLSVPRDQVGAMAILLFAQEIVGDGRSDAAYRWAIETSRRLGVEDCLVGGHEAAALRAVPPSERFVAYPLSAFMRLARREIAILSRLPVATRVERQRVYVLLMILALRDPHLLLYVPHAWLRRLLRKGGPFEARQTELFGADLALPCEHYGALLAATGFDAATQSFERHRYRGHRVHGGPYVVTAERPVDVQIIGPLSRRLGLGESARRVLAALEPLPFSLNVVDYDIGNASRAARVETSRFGPPRAARLNILHLNAEEIPEALAYLPDVFSRAPLVAMPYWELNRPSGVHALGLRAVDELWVASRFLAEIFSRVDKPVHWIGMSASEAAVPSEAARQALRARYDIAPESFLFLTTSDALSWAQRKNPFGVVEAFRAAFPGAEKVNLLVKTQNLDGPLTERQRQHWGEIRAVCASDARITLVGESFDAATQRTLLAACDGFVSLHRAEGLGLDALDALALGRCVVATAYSGTTDHCTNETSWPIAADLVPVDPQDYCFVEPGHAWAEPGLDAACDALRRVVRDPAARQRRSAAGRARVAEQASVAALARRLDARVRAVLAR